MNNFGNRPVALFFWQDVDKCIAIMKELENVEMTANLLLKNSDIVTTIRRVSNSGFDICRYPYHRQHVTFSSLLLVCRLGSVVRMMVFGRQTFPSLCRSVVDR